jgi:SAM-dependent methyltransferase
LDIKSWLVTKIVHDRMRSIAPLYIRGRLVDIGCGRKPYRDMMAPYVTEHVGVDQPQSMHGTDAVDLLGTAYAIPAEEATFDSAICTAVLEHLEEPEQAIRECFRVLKPGGVAVYTVPFIWHLHEEPRDFFRYSKHGLKYLFEKAGFQMERTDALSGFWVTFGQLFVYNLYRFHRGPLRFVPIIPLISLGIFGVARALDRVDKSEQWTWMYLVVARKPSSR